MTSPAAVKAARGISLQLMVGPARGHAAASPLVRRGVLQPTPQILEDAQAAVSSRSSPGPPSVASAECAGGSGSGRSQRGAPDDAGDPEPPAAGPPSPPPPGRGPPALAAGRTSLGAQRASVCKSPEGHLPGRRHTVGSGLTLPGASGVSSGTNWQTAVDGDWQLAEAPKASPQGLVSIGLQDLNEAKRLTATQREASQPRHYAQQPQQALALTPGLGPFSRQESKTSLRQESKSAIGNQSSNRSGASFGLGARSSALTKALSQLSGTSNSPALARRGAVATGRGPLRTWSVPAVDRRPIGEADGKDVTASGAYDPDVAAGEPTAEEPALLPLGFAIRPGEGYEVPRLISGEPIAPRPCSRSQSRLLRATSTGCVRSGSRRASIDSEGATPEQNRVASKLAALRRGGALSGEDSMPLGKRTSSKAKLPQEGMLIDLMKFIMKDKADSFASLTDRMQAFKRSKEDTRSLHATCHVAERVIQVMERKLELMEQLRLKAESYRSAKRDVEATLRRAMEGADVSDVADTAGGFRAFVRGATGESPDLEQAVDWPFFLRNIRLPAGHSTVADAKTLLAEGEEEWGPTALRLCMQEADSVLLPKAEREKRAEERRKRRIFMKAFPETLDGVTVKQVEAVRERVRRCAEAARAIGSLSEEHPAAVELSQLEQDLQTQAHVLEAGGGEGVKIEK